VAVSGVPPSMWKRRIFGLSLSMSFSPSRLIGTVFGGFTAVAYRRMPDFTSSTWHCALSTTCASRILPCPSLGHALWNRSCGR
jgi:hypothetical protein